MRQRTQHGCSTCALFAVALMVVLACARVAPAQLSSDDIAALRERGQREGWTFTVTKNPATGLSLDGLTGVVVPKDWRTRARFDPCPVTRDLPARYDWRDSVTLTPIKNQASCGSCWAFALVGAFESNIVIQDGVTADLSEQWLVSCTGLGGCSGAWPGDAAEFYLCNGTSLDPCGGHGAVLEADFPYEAWDAPCDCPYPHSYCLSSWAFIGPEWGTPTVAQIKQAILDHGPVTVCVYADSAFQAYGGGIFNACTGTEINHAVVLVGWDDSQGSAGVWFMRNSWGPGWGEGGYMKIEYNCSLIGYNALYVSYAGAPPSLAFTYPDGKPTRLNPLLPTSFRVNVSGQAGGTPVPGTGQLHYSVNGAAYATTPMTPISDSQYTATLPGAPCFADVQWYVSVQESSLGMVNDPLDAPATTYSSFVATITAPVFIDDFETNQGWTVYAGATTGNWERAAPQETTYNGEVVQPGEDHSGNGTLCYVTQAAAGSGPGDYDLDGGPTQLTSPVINLANQDAFVSYWRWYHIGTTLDDQFLVEVSNDNGASWVAVETVAARQTWTYVEWRVGDYVTPTAQIRVRFTANDNPNNSLIEALVDDFNVSGLICVPPALPGDVNHDGVVDNFDINPFVYALTHTQVEFAAAYPNGCYACADANSSGVVDNFDINAFVDLLTGG